MEHWGLPAHLRNPVFFGFVSLCAFTNETYLRARPVYSSLSLSLARREAGDLDPAPAPADDDDDDDDDDDVDDVDDEDNGARAEETADAAVCCCARRAALRRGAPLIGLGEEEADRLADEEATVAGTCFAAGAVTALLRRCVCRGVSWVGRWCWL